MTIINTTMHPPVWHRYPGAFGPGALVGCRASQRGWARFLWASVGMVLPTHAGVGPF